MSINFIWLESRVADGRILRAGFRRYTATVGCDNKPLRRGTDSDSMANVDEQ